MADVSDAPDVRVFVRAQGSTRARCTPASAAADIRALLAQDDGSIPRDDAVTLERAAGALEDLAGVAPQQVGTAAAVAPAGANGHVAMAAPAAAEEQQQQQAEPHSKKKKKKKRDTAVAEGLAAVDDPANGREKKKRKKDKQ